MAANDLALRWTTPADLTLTSFASLADGNMWQSGAIDTPASPQELLLQIWYEINFNATPVAGDALLFYLLGGDEDAGTEIWDGGIGTTVGQITAAASIAAVQAAAGIPDHVHAWKTNHGTAFLGHFTKQIFPESWQLIVEADGEALSSGSHRIRYRYGVPQTQ